MKTNNNNSKKRLPQNTTQTSLTSDRTKKMNERKKN